MLHVSQLRFLNVNNLLLCVITFLFGLIVVILSSYSSDYTLITHFPYFYCYYNCYYSFSVDHNHHHDENYHSSHLHNIHHLDTLKLLGQHYKTLKYVVISSRVVLVSTISLIILLSVITRIFIVITSIISNLLIIPIVRLIVVFLISVCLMSLFLNRLFYILLCSSCVPGLFYYKYMNILELFLYLRVGVTLVSPTTGSWLISDEILV
jgi:hypothetical protein